MSALEVIRLVAWREFRTRVLTKASVISTAVILAVIVGGQVIGAAVSGDDEPAAVGLIGAPAELARVLTEAGRSEAAPMKVEQVADAAAARDQVRDGELDVALIAGDGGYTAITESEIDASLQAALEAATQRVAMDAALAEQGVDQARISDALAAAAITVDAIDPADPDQSERIGLAFIAVMLLFFSVYLYGVYVAMGVVEEKSSRVVELLLSTIKPLHLLIGKVIGIGLVGLLQVVLFGGVGLVTGIATGFVTVNDIAAAIFGTVVLWYILGFAFFATLYAGFGALVSRQEDVNSATMPLSVLVFAIYFAAQFSLSNSDAWWVGVLSWVPPFSATLMPLKIAAGEATAVQYAGTVLIMLVMIWLAFHFAARVYQRSVLNVGGGQPWHRAFARAER